MKRLWLVMLTVAAWEDLRERQVSMMLLMCFFIPGMWNMCIADGKVHWWAMLTGLGMLLLSKVTDGSLGKGDGCFFLVSACYLNFKEINLLFLGSLGISCVWAMVLLVKRYWTKDMGKVKDTIPFLTCAWPVGVWLVCR